MPLSQNSHHLFSGLFGQAYSFDQNVQFDPNTGLADNLSDYVGRINLTPADWLDLRYRFLLDQADLKYVRNEVEMVVGPPRDLPAAVLGTQEQPAGGGPVAAVAAGLARLAQQGLEAGLVVGRVRRAVRTQARQLT